MPRILPCPSPSARAPRPAAAALAALALAFGTAREARAQEVAARAVDAAGKPIPGVLVELLGTPVAVETGADGRAALGETPVVVSPRSGAGNGGEGFRIEGGVLRFRLDKPAAFAGELFDASGASLGRLPAAMLLPGGQAVRLPAAVRPEGVLWLRLEVGGRRLALKTVRAGGEESLVRAPASGGAEGAGAAAAKAAAEGDSLRLSKDGFVTEVVAAPSPGRSIEVKMDKGTDFTHLFTGTGRIRDLATGDMVNIPPDRRIHVVLFAEAYTQADIDAGLFKDDSEAWLEKIFSLDPLGAYKEAFVIRRFPSVSNSRYRKADLDIMDGQPPTFFGLRHYEGDYGPRIAGDGAPPSSSVWGILQQNPDLPRRVFDAPRLHLHENHLSNLVPVILINPRKDDPRPWLGGAMILTDFVTNHWMTAAIGAYEPHMFMHALAFLADEWHGRLDTEHSNASKRSPENPGYGTLSGLFQNVVMTRDCASLPWAHLRKGGEFNPSTEGLVGAFGKEGEYHSEFRCLMNWKGDNDAVYPGAGDLREPGRLCNICREITVLRIYERTGVLDDLSKSLERWKASYRKRFYAEHGFKVPAEAPQKGANGQAFFSDCAEPAPRTAQGPSPR